MALVNNTLKRNKFRNVRLINIAFVRKLKKQHISPIIKSKLKKVLHKEETYSNCGIENPKAYFPEMRKMLWTRSKLLQHLQRTCYAKEIQKGEGKIKEEVASIDAHSSKPQATDAHPPSHADASDFGFQLEISISCFWEDRTLVLKVSSKWFYRCATP